MDLKGWREIPIGGMILEAGNADSGWSDDVRRPAAAHGTDLLCLRPSGNQAFATLGHLMPMAWAMDGFQDIVVRGLGLSSVLLPAGLLLAYTVAVFGLAAWWFRFE